MKRLFEYGLLATVLFVPAIVNAADAKFQLGQWHVSYYYTDVSEKNNPEQKSGTLRLQLDMCVKSDGSMYLASNIPTFPIQVQGNWSQLGNTLLMHVNGSHLNLGTWKDTGILTIINSTSLSGPWQAWNADGTANNYLVVDWKFKKKTCDPLPIYD